MLEKGHTVVGFDNFATGHAHNLNDFKASNFSFMEGDIRDLKTCLKAHKTLIMYYIKQLLDQFPVP